MVNKLLCVSIFAYVVASPSIKSIALAKEFTSDDVLIDFGSAKNPPAQLSSDQVSTDTEFLVYLFKRAYGGYKTVDQQVIASAEQSLLAIPNQLKESSPQAFCDAIARVFNAIPDSHLGLELAGKSCGEKHEKLGRVGHNVAPSRKIYRKPWKITRVLFEGISVPILSITGFPQNNDPVWNGFEAAYKSLSSEPLLIIDMRGNPGGNDTRGFELANWLYGGPVPMLAEDRIRRQTPESVAILLNSLREMKTSQPNPALDEAISEFEGYYVKAKASHESEDAIDHLEHKRRFIGPARPFKGKIYILVDAKCGSSCESSLDGLRTHPNAVVVGENTSGAIHFGNLGLALLPNSKIGIDMGTQYIRYKGGKSYEKVGFEPDLRCAPGEDALLKAIGHYRSSFSKPNASGR